MSLQDRAWGPLCSQPGFCFSEPAPGWEQLQPGQGPLRKPDGLWFPAPFSVPTPPLPQGLPEAPCARGWDLVGGSVTQGPWETDWGGRKVTLS